jgi:hypothetical protein
MPPSHVQVQPDGTGKDIDADSIVSTEAGTPVVYRQDVVAADPVTYASKTRVFAPGEQRVHMEASQLLIDTFDASLDTVNRWATPVAAGTGAIAATWSAGQILLTGGTAANAYSELHSQPSFDSEEPGWLLVSMRINVENPVLTTAYRFWGIGQTTGTPTVAAPLTDACGWEVTTAGKLFAVSYASGTRIPIADLSTATGNGTQPGDANAHKYYLYFRGDVSYWSIDNLDSVVASFATGASGPNVNSLPLKLLAVSNSGTTATIQVNGVSVGDTSRSSVTLSDGSYAWRQATVTPGTQALATVPLASASALTQVASSASSVTLLAANLSRKTAIFYNASTAILYIALTSAAASTTAYTVQVAPSASWSLPVAYTGQITGIWASANGNAIITELS